MHTKQRTQPKFVSKGPIKPTNSLLLSEGKVDLTRNREMQEYKHPA